MRQLHPEKNTVWRALWSEGVIGPYSFENDDGTNVTFNSERYGSRYDNPLFFCLLLKNTTFRICGFTQLERSGNINWPPRSCDLTPLDLFCGAT